jgi:VanZ family protein
VSGGVISDFTPATRVGRGLWLWAPVAGYMALIFVLSGMASPPTPAQASDKTLHFVGYGGLGVVALRATAAATMSGVTGGSAAAAWTIASLYGLSDEYHQSFVPERTADVADAVADAAGAAATIVPVWAFGIIARSRRSSGAAPRRR